MFLVVYIRAAVNAFASGKITKAQKLPFALQKVITIYHTKSMRVFSLQIFASEVT